MAKWKVKIWQVPLEFIVEADTATQAEQEIIDSQGLGPVVAKVKVWQNETSIEFDDVILNEEDQKGGSNEKVED